MRRMRTIGSGLCGLLLLAGTTVWANPRAPGDAWNGGQQPANGGRRQAQPYRGQNGGSGAIPLQEYGGRHQQDDRLPATQARIEQNLTDAATAVTTRTGLPAAPTGAVVAELADGGVRGGATAVRGRGEEDPQTVRIDATEALEPEDEEAFEAAITRAVFEATLFANIDERAERAIPRWLREGVASYAADEASLRITWVLEQFPEDPTEVLNGLGGGWRDPHDRVEALLAVTFLAEEAGTASFKEFVRKVFVNEVDYRDAIREATDLEWDAFAERAGEYAAEVLREEQAGRAAE